MKFRNKFLESIFLFKKISFIKFFTSETDLLRKNGFGSSMTISRIVSGTNLSGNFIFLLSPNTLPRPISEGA